MKTLLAWWEKWNKDNNNRYCYNKQELFQLVLSDYIMLGRKAQSVLVSVSCLISEKRRNPFRMCVDGLTKEGGYP